MGAKDNDLAIHAFWVFTNFTQAWAQIVNEDIYYIESSLVNDT